MKTKVYKSDTRGHANHGWLVANHSFSFAGFYNPEKMNFGVLRVLNDDTIAGGMGFGAHPHRDMEIITIPLEGDLKHGDNMGNEGIIHKGEVQVMSAGTGVVHSEYNANPNRQLKLLQIWVFAREINVSPRYDQITFDTEIKNKFQQIVSPNKEDDGAWIHQDAWFNLGEFNEDKTITYEMHQANQGVYAFVIKGEIKIGEIILSEKDGIGIYDVTSFDIDIKAGSEVLLMEIPMDLPSYVTN